MGRVTSNGNEAKLKMNCPSDVPTPRIELAGPSPTRYQLDHGGALAQSGISEVYTY